MNKYKELYDIAKEKIDAVTNCIRNCSFSKKTPANNVEEAILQDADRIEAMGSIAIMRTFASAGAVNNGFYNEEDPFGKTRELNAKLYPVDLFPERLLIIPEHLNTQTAKEIAKPRLKVLNVFLESLKEELEEIA